jgi:predicted dehydrogenase
MSGAIRAAVVGTGAIARQHLACLESLPGVEVAAVCDISPAAAEAAAERHGVEAWFTDRGRLLAEVAPHVVHVTTPPHAHFEIALDAIEAGAAAIVEKPLTLDPADTARLVALARERGVLLVEDYNYLFQSQTLAIEHRRAAGELGEVTHVEVDLALAAEGGTWDVLPHLASLAHAFAGPHRTVAVAGRNGDGGQPRELAALVEGERATAALRYSELSQPDGFWLRVHGTRGRAEANLFEPRITLERLRGGPRPLNPLINQLVEAGSATRAAVGGVLRKLSGGPGSYEGLWELLARTYRAIAAGGPPPVSLEQIEEVNRLVADVRAGGRGA